MPMSAAVARTPSPAAPPFAAGQSFDVIANGRAEAEFERRRTINAGLSRSLVERVAALLVAISRTNGYEGRDPTAVPDTLTSGFVADLLGVSVASLASALVELKERGLIAAAAPSGLRLEDMHGLERLAAER